MFRAVRHWWAGGHGKVTARLFVFELVVVILGVLIAQGLANWVSDRGALTRMEESRARALREMADNLAYGQAWRVAVPCLDRRLAEIMRSAAGGTLASDVLKRPRFPNFILTPIDDQSELLLRRRHGDRTADLMNVIRSDFDAAGERLDSIIDDWGRLSLADPSYGAVSGADRTQVRTAAADMRANLRSLDNLIAHARVTANAAGIRPYSADPFRPAASCAEIWERGDIAIANRPPR